MAESRAAGRLAGFRVLVTRPVHQAGALCGLVEREGGRAFAVATIEIAPPADAEDMALVLRQLGHFDLAVFVSPNAVGAVCQALAAPWPQGVRVAAVGRGTEEALARYGLRADIRPAHDFRSEGLLQEEAMRQVAGRRIVIFRGDGGRELLAETLRARGAEVRYAPVYRRRLPADAPTALDRLVHSQPVDAVVVTSNEGLLNLYECAGERHRAWLLSRRLAVIGERTAALAATLGFERPARIAAEASDRGLVDALAALAQETTT